MSNRTDLTQFEGHTEGPWQTNDCDSQGVWQEHDESIPRHIAMVHSDQDWEDMTEAEFMRMMADKQLVTAAPDLLDELKRCYEEIDRLLETIGSWGYAMCPRSNEWFEWDYGCQSEICASHDDDCRELVEASE